MPVDRARGPARRGIGAVLVVAALCGCGTLGSIDDRAQSFNKASADYAAAAILYNILRASRAEPLHFVSLTGVTGHDTLTANLGLPTFVLGPGRPEADKLFLFGPNLVGGTTSNDFNINVIDDPSSYAALLRPVDPATMGFFINEGYEPWRIFFLFVQRIRILDPTTMQPILVYIDPKTGKLVDNGDLSNDPLTFYRGRYVFNHGYLNFYNRLDMYLDQGLSVKVDPAFVPQISGAAGKAVLCFDRKEIDQRRFPNFYNDPTKPRHPCPPELAASTIGAAGVRAPPPARRKAHRGASHNVAANKSVAGEQQPEPDFTFIDQDGHLVQLQTRSVFGAYRFLGEMLLLREELKNEPAIAAMTDLFSGQPATDFLDIIHRATSCWTSVGYEGAEWCVPTTAIGTKRLFAILHQLFELYASPSNQPATATVRVTPG